MYNTDYSMNTYDPYEEERKRREQELLQQQGAVAPMDLQTNTGFTGELPVNANAPVSPDQLAQSQATQVAGPMPQPQTKYDMGEFAGVDEAIKRQQGQQPQPQTQTSSVPGTTGAVRETQGASTVLAQNTTPFNQAFTGALGDERKLWDVYNNSQYSSEERLLAGKQLNTLMAQKQKQAEAEQAIRNSTPQDLMRHMASRKEEGSWIRAGLYGLLGMENSAKAEASKLGLGTWQTMMIGNEPVKIKIGPDGSPIEGYSGATGRMLDPKQLVTAAAQGTLQKGTTTHTGKMQDMTTGEVYYEQTSPQGIKLVDNQGKTYSGPSANLRPFGIGSDIQTKNQIQLNELRNKLAYAGPMERAKVVAENEARFGPLDAATKAQALGQVSGTVPTQTTQAPAQARPAQAQPAPQVSGQVSVPVNPFEQPAPMAAPVTQAQPAPAATTGAKPSVAMSGGKLVVSKTPPAEGGATGATVGGDANAPAPALTAGQREAQQAGRLEVVKKAGDIIANSDKIITDLEKTNSSIDTLKNKKTNFGTVIHGTIPGEQAIGQAFKTQDYINTQSVLDQVNKQAAINAKMLGVNPTDRDLQFVTSTKPDENWSPQAVEEWMRRSAEGSRRSLDFARKQLETGGSYVPPTTQPRGEEESLTPQQRAQQELEKRKKKK